MIAPGIFNIGGIFDDFKELNFVIFIMIIIK